MIYYIHKEALILKEYKIKIISPDSKVDKYSWVGIKYDHYTNSNERRFYLTDEKRAGVFTEDELKDGTDVTDWIRKENKTYDLIEAE